MINNIKDSKLELLVKYDQMGKKNELLYKKRNFNNYLLLNMHPFAGI